MGMVRAHVWISGRVQGVFFRANTCREAQSLGVCGWVKNCPDGRVEAVFEGKRALVEKIVAWCYRGSSYAYVQDVQVDWEDYQGEFKSFDIWGW